MCAIFTALNCHDISPVLCSAAGVSLRVNGTSTHPRPFIEHIAKLGGLCC